MTPGACRRGRACGRLLGPQAGAWGVERGDRLRFCQASLGMCSPGTRVARQRRCALARQAEPVQGGRAPTACGLRGSGGPQRGREPLGRTHRRGAPAPGLSLESCTAQRAASLAARAHAGDRLDAAMSTHVHGICAARYREAERDQSARPWTLTSQSRDLNSGLSSPTDQLDSGLSVPDQPGQSVSPDRNRSQDSIMEQARPGGNRLATGGVGVGQGRANLTAQQRVPC